MSRSVHFIGLCGVGMSATAILMRDQGWTVTGSDEGFYDPQLSMLLAEGLPPIEGHRAANIPAEAERVVIGRHAKLTPDTNEEVAEAFRLQAQGKVVVRSFPDELEDLAAQTHNIVVTGSFGKSSTATMAAWALHHAGADPSWFLGVVPNGFPQARLGGSDWFVLEGDEYPTSNWDDRSKFVRYRPTSAILTSLVHDHKNFFKTEESYVERFRELVAMLPPSGVLAACGTGYRVPEVAALGRARVVTYGGDGPWDMSFRAFERIPGGSVFELWRRGERLGEVELSNMLGVHNAENAAGVAAMLLEHGAVSFDALASALACFPGMKRRCELKTPPECSVAVYEDLSSSREKAMAFLAALRGQFPDRRIHAFFQPHTFSFRSRASADWYAGMFADASRVVLFSPPSLRGLGADEMGTQEILELIRAGFPGPVAAVGDAESAVAELAPVEPGDVVAVMTSGNMGNAIPALVSAVVARFG